MSKQVGKKEKLSSKDEDRYFNASHAWKALKIADEKYPVCYRIADIKKSNKTFSEKVWYRNVKSSDGLSTTIEIGIRGKIWALCALTPFLRDTQDILSLKDTSNEIWTYDGEIIPTPRQTSIGGHLITAGRRQEAKNLDILDDVNLFFEQTVAYFAEKLSKSSKLNLASGFDDARTMSEVIHRGMAIPATSPSECLKNVLVELGLISQIVIGIPPVHRLDQTFEQYMATESSGSNSSVEIDKLVNETHFELSRSTRTVMIKGQRNSGKKSVICDLLHRLKEETTDESISLKLGGHQDTSIPVFAASIPFRSYLNLAIEVLVFLSSLKNKVRFESHKEFNEEVKSRIHKYTRAGATANLTIILQNIESLSAEYPALYILSDADGLEMDSLSRYLDRQGINRLHETLRRGNKDNRFFLTGSQHLDVAGLSAEEAEIKKMPLPTIGRLAWYLNDVQRTSLHTFLQKEDFDPAILTKSINGEILLALAMIYPDVKEKENICGKQPQISEADLTKFFALVKEVVDDISIDGNTNGALGKISRALIHEWKDQGALRVLACIAASDDGVSPSTLLWMLDEWNKIQDPKSDSEKVFKYLKYLKSKAKNLGLSLREVAHFDAREYSCDEPMTNDTWRMSKNLSKAIVSALQGSQINEESHLIRTAYRLVAIAARRRAQLRRVRGKSFDPAEAGYSGARDIQCFISLLASLNPTKTLDSTILATCSVSLNAHRIYTLDSAEFSPEITLAHAVKDLLHQSIDRDFRLSMASDQDALRLRLYLLLFMPFGFTHYWSVGELRENGDTEKIGLPTEIPAQLSAVFTDLEIIKLLTTISLSAYYCQLPSVVLWSKQIASKLMDDNPKNFENNVGAMARILCSYIDASIAYGKPLRHLMGTTTGNLLDVLRDCQEYIETYFPSIDCTTDANSFLESAGSVSNCKGWMRLRAREAELTWITGADETVAASIYQELAESEEKMAHISDQQYPIIFSGRTSRRYLRFLTKDNAIYTLGDEPPDDSERKHRSRVNVAVRNLIERNIGRLERFSGAEGVGALLDLARRRNYVGETEAAYKYVEEARPRVYSGDISHSGKVEWLTLSLALSLARVEQMASLPGENLNNAGLQILHQISDQARSLVETAEYLKFKPTIIIGKYLVARGRMLLERIGNDCDIELPYSHYQSGSQLLKMAIGDANRQNMGFAAGKFSQLLENRGPAHDHKQ